MHPLPHPERNGTRPPSPAPRPATPPSSPPHPAAGGVSRLDRVTLQLRVAVAVVIAVCSYAVSATSLYALGVEAGYSWWQAAAVPVVADGPAIYGMFRIVSRSRRSAKGAGCGWLLVGGGRCPPGPDPPTPQRSGRGCRPPMPNRGPMARPGRPALWPRLPAVAAAAPPASCNASAHRLRRISGEPPEMASAGRGAWLCLPRHPRPAPPLPPAPPNRPPAGPRPPTASDQGRLLVSGSGLRPACQAPSGQPRPPRGHRHHDQSGPDPGLVGPPPPGQYRPGHRPHLRRPGHRRPRRRPRHPGVGARPWPAELGAVGSDRWGWLALLRG